MSATLMRLCLHGPTYSLMQLLMLSTLVAAILSHLTAVDVVFWHYICFRHFLTWQIETGSVIHRGHSRVNQFL